MKEVAQTVYTLGDLLQAIRDFKSRIPKDHEVWYRGQGNADYRLVPSLARRADWTDKEKAIYELCQRHSIFLLGSQKRDWELLIDMQHYFVPTRLLDWTETLGIALFFAVLNFHDETDMAIFLLDPQRLNEKSRRYNIPVLPDQTEGLSYVENYLEKRPFPPMSPIAVKCSFSNARVKAQRGLFTVHGDNNDPIDVICADVVEKIIVSKTAVSEIRDFLEIANINEITVFPDFAGLSDYIRHYML